MKVILTGPTGFIGQQVLEQCPSITLVVALSRRELPAPIASNPKLKVSIVDDFLSYSDTLMHDIKGAEACIWSLGKSRMPDNETNRRVSVEYTLAAAKVFRQEFASQNHEAKKFRFVYLSGAGAERDQTKSLWAMQDYRKIRGQVENELLAFAREHQDTFESYIFRPGMVLSKETNLRSLVFGLGPSVRTDILAAAMLEVAVKGNEQQILENSDISRLRN